MLRNLFTRLLCGGATFALAACCGSVACDKQDDYADALLFRFNLAPTSPLGGFSPADVDTVYLRRHTIPPANSNIKSTFETVQIVRLQSNAAQSITLNNNTPFTYTNRLKLDGYRYTLFVVRYLAASKKTVDTVRYSIDNVRLDGNYQGDGCCTYYENKSKTANVSEMKVDGVRTNTYPNFNFKGPNRDQNIFVLNRY